jgi:hypothetical protein
MDETIPFGSFEYCVLLALLLFARGMDFLSTWVATPRLVLEGNPIAKWLGWKWGALVNLIVCALCAVAPLPAIIISTTSLLVAARNFQGAWLMRVMGEYEYRIWMSERLVSGRRGLYIACLVAQCALVAFIGIVLIWYGVLLIPVGIGYGMLVFAIAVLFYSLLSLVRSRSGSGS